MTNETAPDAAPMQCMEIWGGNTARDNAVSLPGLDVHVYSEPYEHAQGGGDIHYMSMCAAGAISRFAVADVSGHGDAVSDLAGALRTLMRKHINTVDQSKFIGALNDEFGRMSEMGRFATAVLATYYAPTDHLVVCNAGHPRPLWFHSASRTWSTLSQDNPAAMSTPESVGAGDLPLGIIEPTSYSQFAVPLDRGDAVLLYTDSMVEAMDPGSRQLGEDGLLALVRDLDPSDPVALCRELVERVRAHRAGAESDDDETVIVMHHNGSDPPRQTMGEKIRVLGRMLGVVPEQGMPA